MARTILILILFVVIGCTNTLERRAMEAENTGDYATAIELWSKYIDRCPNDLVAYIERGVDRSLTGDYVGAVKDYSFVIDRDSAHVLAYFNRGKNQYRMDQNLLAVADFNEAIRIKGGDADGNLPAIYLEPVDNPVLDITTDPRDVPFADILFERGSAYYGLDSLRRAFHDFSYCIECGYLLHDSHFIRGEIYERYGMRDEAALDYQASVFYSSRNGGVYTQTASERLRTLNENK